MIVQGYGTATKPADAIDLSGYPGLTYAPAQHGEGIRFAANGRPIADIATGPQAAASAATSAIDGIAHALGVPFADVCDALKYLRGQKSI